MKRFALGLMLSASMLGPLAMADRAQAEEPTALLEIGGSGERGIGDGQFSRGPSVGIEFTAIKEWLEVEGSVGSLFRGGRQTSGADLILKKPFDLSPTLEFEFGAGPSWDFSGHSLAATAALELMIWSTPEHAIGWYVEPSYSYDLGKGHERTTAIAVGLLIGLR